MKKLIAVLVSVVVFGSTLSASAREEKATFAAGCFWCMQALYQRVPGVVHVVAGFAGGQDAEPTYASVSTGRTGHAETIDVTFDPDKVSYEKLLDLFWRSHDPTNPRGVEPDFGTEYRSIIFYRNAAQKEAVEKSREEAQEHYSKPIATEIVPFTKFYPAEEYHQDYVRRHPDDPYVRSVSLPKLTRLADEKHRE